MSSISLRCEPQNLAHTASLAKTAVPLPGAPYPAGRDRTPLLDYCSMISAISCAGLDVSAGAVCGYLDGNQA